MRNKDTDKYSGKKTEQDGRKHAGGVAAHGVVVAHQDGECPDACMTHPPKDVGRCMRGGGRCTLLWFATAYKSWDWSAHHK